MNLYKQNRKLFKKENLSANDVLLRPNLGNLASRSMAKIDSGWLFSAPMDTVTGYDLCKIMLEHNQKPVLSRFLNKEERTRAILDFVQFDNFYIAVSGDFEFEFNYLTSLVEKGMLFNICLDVAHGDTEQMHITYSKWRKSGIVKNLMSGSIATGEAALRCLQSGCNVLRVGIGPGAACTTRSATGVGVPQLSAVFEVARCMERLHPSTYERSKFIIIADGGINTSGDIVKYLSAGADAVMLGKLLSRTEESAGWHLVNNKKTKRYRGQASKEFQLEQYGVAKNIEGESGNEFSPSYNYSDFQQGLEDGIRSAISYLGVSSISHLHPGNIEFVRITMNGFQESKTNL